jgi:hypothetical protein
MNKQEHIDQPQIDQGILELLYGSIDGELDAAQQGELDSLLAGSKQVRDLDKDLRSFIQILDDVPERKAPEYLQDAIERQIRLPVPGDGFAEKQGFLRSWLPTHWLQTGFALTAGVVLTIGVYEMGSGPMTAEDTANMVGTVVQSPASQGELLDSVNINTDGLNGVAELRNQGELFTLDVELTSVASTELVVHLSGKGFAFEGISRKQAAETAVSVGQDTINITSIGTQRYILSLRRIPGTEISSPLDLEFFANDALVHETALVTAKK